MVSKKEDINVRLLTMKSSTFAPDFEIHKN